jgi:tRNA(Ile)-lysidine synthase
LRHAAAQLGAAPDFKATELLRALALDGRVGQKLELAQGLNAERTARELRLTAGAAHGAGDAAQAVEYTVAIPGQIDAPAFGLRIKIAGSVIAASVASADAPGAAATLRNWKPGDRVRLRYSSGPRKVKEVLERMKVTGTARAVWPVLELQGVIIWMRGVEVEPTPGIAVEACFDDNTGHAKSDLATFSP